MNINKSVMEFIELLKFFFFLKHKIWDGKNRVVIGTINMIEKIIY